MIVFASTLEVGEGRERGITEDRSFKIKNYYNTYFIVIIIDDIIHYSITNLYSIVVKYNGLIKFKFL